MGILMVKLMRLRYLLGILFTALVGCDHTPLKYQDNYELCQSLAYGYSEEVVQELESRGRSASDKECGDAKRRKQDEIELRHLIWSAEHTIRHES